MRGERRLRAAPRAQARPGPLAHPTRTVGKTPSPRALPLPDSLIPPHTRFASPHRTSPPPRLPTLPLRGFRRREAPRPPLRSGCERVSTSASRRRSHYPRAPPSPSSGHLPLHGAGTAEPQQPCPPAARRGVTRRGRAPGSRRRQPEPCPRAYRRRRRATSVTSATANKEAGGVGRLCLNSAAGASGRCSAAVLR